MNQIIRTCVKATKIKVMKRIFYFILIANIMLAFMSCNSSRDVAERRSLMMPKKSEIPRNAKKYKERDRNYSYYKN